MKKNLSFLLAFGLVFSSLAGCAPQARQADTKASVSVQAIESGDSSRESLSNNAKTSAPETAEASVPENAEISGPGTGGGESSVLKIGVPTAPPALPVLHMMSTNALGDQVEIQLDVWDGPEQLIAMVQDGGHQMFAFPLTVVAKLYNKGLDVQLMNVNTWGVTYFLTSDPDFRDWSDLKGKTVYVPLQSSPPDALTQYFISAAGLKVGEDVEIIYASTPEVTSLLASGKAVYATQIEPQVTAALSQNPDVRRALSFEEEWQKATGTDTMIPNAGFGALASFTEENPELAARFEKAYEESLEWVLEHPEEAAALAEEHLGMKARMVQKAIPTMGLYYKSALDAKAELDTFYQMLNEFDAAMIGGEIPDEDMYYHEP